MKHLIFFALAVFVAASLGGCAYSSGTVSPAHPVLIGKPESLDCIEVFTTSALEDSERERISFNDRVFSDLRETGLFASVNEGTSSNSPGAGIKIESRITEINKVSDSARVWYGGLAGQARIVVQVTISDLSSGRPLETFEAVGLSGKSARAGTTEEAIQRAAEQVAAQVVKINSETVQLL